MSRDEQELSVKLKVPIFGPRLSATKQYSTKTGARALFKEADMNIAPGATIMSGHSDGYQAKDISQIAQREIAAKLVSLVKENPFVRKWVFKVNNEYESRGHATVDLRKVPPLSDVAQRVDNLISPSTPEKPELVVRRSVGGPAVGHGGA